MSRRTFDAEMRRRRRRNGRQIGITAT